MPDIQQTENKAVVQRASNTADTVSTKDHQYKECSVEGTAAISNQHHRAADVAASDASSPAESNRAVHKFRPSSVRHSQRSEPRTWRDSSQLISLQKQLREADAKNESLTRDYDNLSQDWEAIRKESRRFQREKEYHKAEAASAIATIRDLKTLLEQVQKDAESKKKERNELQIQNVELKTSLATMGRTEGQVSDDFLRQLVGDLAHEVQNWVVKSTRTLRLTDNIRFLSRTCCNALYNAIPQFDYLANPSKRHIVQSIMAQELVNIFSRQILIPFDSETAVQTLQRVFIGNSDRRLLNHWRSMTYSMLYNMNDIEFDELRVGFTRDSAHYIDAIFQELLDAHPDPVRFNGLARIVANVAKLARCIRMQRAEFHFQIPIMDTFRPEDMNDENGQDAPDAANLPVVYAIFPMLVKFGDEYGENMNFRNVISKARVVYSAAPTDDGSKAEDLNMNLMDF